MDIPIDILVVLMYLFQFSVYLEVELLSHVYVELQYMLPIFQHSLPIYNPIRRVREF